MDRFRFRVWFTPDYQEPEMIYDAEQTYDFGCQSKGSYHHDNFGEILEDKDCIVMQCTGLKDKNGKLIYEGDIVTTVVKNLNGDVIINRPDVIEYDKKLCMFRNYFTTLHRKLEVIGNIYQNKELLED